MRALMQANERKPFGTPLAIQCLGLRVSTAGSWEGGGGGRSLITGQGTKIPLALLCGQKKKKRKKTHVQKFSSNYVPFLFCLKPYLLV